MNTEQLIAKLLVNPRITQKTQMFLSDLKNKARTFGDLTPGQTAVLKRIAQENGITLEKQETTVGYESEPKRIFEEIKGTCGSCADGVVLARHMENNNLYAFLCTCNIGLKRPESYPRWDRGSRTHDRCK